MNIAAARELGLRKRTVLHTDVARTICIFFFAIFCRASVMDKPKPDVPVILTSSTTTRRPLVLTTSSKFPVPKPTTPFPISNRNDGNFIYYSLHAFRLTLNTEKSATQRERDGEREEAKKKESV